MIEEGSPEFSFPSRWLNSIAILSSFLVFLDKGSSGVSRIIPCDRFSIKDQIFKYSSEFSFSYGGISFFLRMSVMLQFDNIPAKIMLLEKI